MFTVVVGDFLFTSMHGTGHIVKQNNVVIKKEHNKEINNGFQNAS